MNKLIEYVGLLAVLYGGWTLYLANDYNPSVVTSEGMRVANIQKIAFQHDLYTTGFATLGIGMIMFLGGHFASQKKQT